MNEMQACIALLKAHCTKGMAVIDPNIGGATVYIDKFVPKAEIAGLEEKLFDMEPFKTGRQFYFIGIGELPRWRCNFQKYQVKTIN